MKSLASKPPSTKCFRALLTIFSAVSFSIPVISAMSTGPLTMRSMTLWTPASDNFLVVTGPTPSKLSNLKSSTIPYGTVLVLYNSIVFKIDREIIRIRINC